MRLTILLLMVSATLTGTAAPALRAVKSKDHRTERAGIPLALYEKWLAGEETKWKTNGKVVLLVHGATWSSRCTFDPAPGYSLMDTLAEAGYDVWAIDLHGYGASGSSTEEDLSDAASVVADLDLAVDYIRSYRFVERVGLFGYQWGAQVVAQFAEKKPHKIDRMALFGMRYMMFDKVAEPTSWVRMNSAAIAQLKPEDGDFDPAMAAKRADLCLLTDPRSPNGPLRDLGRPSVVDPKKVNVPTLVIAAERDGDAQAHNDRIDFFRALATRAKWFVLLPQLGKHAPLERGHSRFDRAVIGFFDSR